MAESEAALRGFSKANRPRSRSEAARLGWRHRPRQHRMRRDARDRQQGLALAYRIQQLPHSAFEARFRELRERQGVQYSQRGMETRWVLYLSSFSTYRAKGQDFRTTNLQRAASLERRGRCRTPRTVQRAIRDLAAMGLLHSFHVRRGGARRGNRDCLRIRFLSFVTPPSAAGARGLRPILAPAPARAGCAGRGGRPAAPARAAPPDGGRVGSADDQLQHPGGEAISAPALTADREESDGSDRRAGPPWDGPATFSDALRWAQQRRREEEARE